MTTGRAIQTEVNRGLAWFGLAATWVSLLDVVANILILKFWITPEEYGIAALAITLYPVLDLAADMGLTAALIQRDDHNEAKISTVFWLNVAMSLVLFALLGLVVGPLLAHIQGHPVIASLLAAYGLKLVWANVYQMPKAMMRRELRFKELAAVRGIANFLEFLGKVGFAAGGAGIWCFVLGPFCREFGWGIGIQICHPWRPRLILRLREASSWAWFGLKSSSSQILFFLYTNVDYQVVGYFFGAEANGFYRLAYDIVLEPCRILANIVVQVAFPAYSRLKSYRKELIDQFVALTRLNLIVILGFLLIVVVASHELIASFWGAQWLPAASATRILAVVGVLRALSFMMPPLLDGMGYPGRSLAYNTLASIVLPLAFVASATLLGDSMGYLSVAVAWAGGYPIAFVVLLVMSLDVLELGGLAYLRRVSGVLLCALAAGAAAVGAHRALAGLSAGLRLGATTAVILVVFFGTLARWQGVTPRAIARALRGD